MERQPDGETTRHCSEFRILTRDIRICADLALQMSTFYPRSRAPTLRHAYVEKMFMLWESLGMRLGVCCISQTMFSMFPIHVSWEPDQSYYVKMAIAISLSW